MPQRPRLTPPVANARRAIRVAFSNPELTETKKVLLAVSGGPDSIALANACAFELPKLGIEIHAAIIDHDLQPGSAEVALKAQQTLESLAIKARVVRIKVTKRGEGLEAAARTARYSALEKVRLELGADLILLGHNQDDQAESVLLGLTRGSGLKSIAGMKVLDGHYLRPLLGISKADLRQACLDAGLEFWDDPHNLDDAFTRVKIRRLLNDLDQDLGPGLQAALARTAELASEADEVICAEAEKLLAIAQTSRGLSTSLLADALAATRRKALLIWLQQAGAKTPSRAQVLAVEGLITNWHGQKPLKLSGITVERVAQELVTTKSR